MMASQADHSLSVERRKNWQESYNLRPAHETDIPFLAWVMQESARSHMEKGIWDYMFPGDEAQRLGILAAILRLEPISFCHYSRFWVLERNGLLSAAVACYEPEKHSIEVFAATLISFLRKQGWSNDELFRLIVTFSPYHTCFPKEENGSLILEWIATKPEARRHGVGAAMLCHMIEFAKLNSYDFLQISHYIGNQAIKNVVEKLGFVYQDKKTSSRFEEQFGSPGMARYIYRNAGKM